MYLRTEVSIVKDFFSHYIHLSLSDSKPKIYKANKSYLEIDLTSGIWVLVNFPISLLNAAGPEGLTAWAWGLINQP